MTSVNEFYTPYINGRQGFDVVKVQLNESIAAEPLSATLTLNHHSDNDRLRPSPIPKFAVGSLVAAMYGGGCSHVGVVINTTKETVSIALWPLTAGIPILARTRHGSEPKTLPRASHLCYARTDTLEFFCTVSKLNAADADDLRAQIGAYVPDAILDTFWTESEQENLTAEWANAQSFTEKVNELLAST